jgi:hypothetical protein
MNASSSMQVFPPPFCSRISIGRLFEAVIEAE